MKSVIIIVIAGLSSIFSTHAVIDQNEEVKEVITIVRPDSIDRIQHTVITAISSIEFNIDVLKNPTEVNIIGEDGTNCNEWKGLATHIGWPEEEWKRLSYVIHRESRCLPTSFNEEDPYGGSMGLMQINSFWCKPWRLSATGWLQEQGILSHCDELYDPEINLRAGLAIFKYGEETNGCGWKGAWYTRC